jgi:membrane protein required for colicin V production
MTALDILLLLPLGIGAVKGYRRGLVLEVASLLAFVLAVVGGLSLLSAAVPLVRHYVTPLGVLDNLLGGVAGVVKWVLGLSLLLHGTGLAGLHLLSPGLVAHSQVLPFVQQATPLALQITGYVLPFAQDLLVRIKAAFIQTA